MTLDGRKKCESLYTRSKGNKREAAQDRDIENQVTPEEQEKSIVGVRPFIHACRNGPDTKQYSLFPDFSMCLPPMQILPFAFITAL